MCELLALSTSESSHLTFSLHTLASHGRKADSSHDGWGVAFYQGADVALFREPSAAGDSELVHYLESHGPSTSLAISHIRHATRGGVQLSNTQPFMRAMGGTTHVFAHNGDLPGVGDSLAVPSGGYHPIGQTDSEQAFCALLARLSPLWTLEVPPPLEARFAILYEFSAELRNLGPANFLYADGDALFAHSHKRRQWATGKLSAPGLWLSQRHCQPIDPAPSRMQGVAITTTTRHALIVASVPLSNDSWTPLGEGELLAVRAGSVLMRQAAIPDGAHLMATHE